MPKKTLAKFVYDKLQEGKWPGVTLDERKQSVRIPSGDILISKKGKYHFYFYYFSIDTRQLNLRSGYNELIFPKNLDIRKVLYFKTNGNYKINNERQFKKVVNPLGKHVNKIKLSTTSTNLKFYKDSLILPIRVFKDILKDAEYINTRSTAYRNSAENYLSNIKSHKYSNKIKRRTTYMEKGEFRFLVDRLYLKSKENKSDYLKYLDENDLKGIEELLSELLRHDVLSRDFLRILNDFFIKEKLKDIIALGREILALKTTNLTTATAQQVITRLGLTEAGQLESLWQKYFENYLLYLIFTYKKIFPKVELKNIDGDKKYPDFIGINHYNGLDVIEIKTHLKNALMWDSSHENFYFSPEMSKAIVQTTNYMDAIVQVRFQYADDQTKITQSTDEENLYHPRGIIVISSQAKLTTKTGQDEKLRRDFTKLRNSLHNIEIITFDEILNIADEYIKNIVPEEENG